MIQKLKAIWSILSADRFALFSINILDNGAKHVDVYAALIPKRDHQFIEFIESLERDVAVNNTEGAPVVDPRLN